MKLKTSGDIFRSPLVPAAAVLYSLATLLGIVGVVLLFDRDFARLLTEDLVLSGFTDASSVQTWTVINTGITLVCFLCPCVTAACLWAAIAGNRLRGILTLSRATQWLLYGVNGGGILTAVIFVVRFVLYIIVNIRTPMAAYSLLALFLFEIPMAAQAAFLFHLLRKFLNCVMDSATGIACALASGKPEQCSIPGFTATGFLILGIITLLLSIDRVFTLTIVPHNIQDYFAILVAEHPGMWLSGGNLLAIAAGNFLLHLYLRRCKRDTERWAFYANRLKQ